MRLEPLRPEDSGWALALYEEAFPEWERVSPAKLASYLGRGSAEALAIAGDEGPVGFMYVVPGDDLVFLQYLAVSASRRGQGVGTEAVRLLLERHAGKRVFLNVEPPDEGCPNMSQRLARMRFYSRLGFEPAGRLRCAEGDFVTLVRGGPLDPGELGRFRREHDFTALFDGDAVLGPL